MVAVNDWIHHVEPGAVVLVQTDLGPVPQVLVIRAWPQGGLPSGVMQCQVANPHTGTRTWVPHDRLVHGGREDGSLAEDASIDYARGARLKMHDWKWLDGYGVGEPIWFNTPVGRVEMRYRGPALGHGNMYWVEHPKTAVQYRVHKVDLTPKDKPLPFLEGIRVPVNESTEFGTDGTTTDQPEPRSVPRPEPAPIESKWSEDVVISLLAQLQVCSSLLATAAHMSTELGKPVMARVFENQVSAVDQTIEDVQGEM